jgi:hypothetical protein
LRFPAGRVDRKQRLGYSLHSDYQIMKELTSPSTDLATSVALPATRASKSDFLRLVHTAFLMMAVGLTVANHGCSKQSKTPVVKETDAMPVNPAAAPSDQEKALQAQRLAFRQGIEPPAPALKLRGGELATPEVLAAYNQELARAVFRERDSPESLQELVQNWVELRRQLPKLPTPPSGKRIVYDDHFHIIRLDPP